MTRLFSVIVRYGSNGRQTQPQNTTTEMIIKNLRQMKVGDTFIITRMTEPTPENAESAKVRNYLRSQK